MIISFPIYEGTTDCKYQTSQLAWATVNCGRTEQVQYWCWKDTVHWCLPEIADLERTNKAWHETTAQDSIGPRRYAMA
jgi:hypothetical protein